MVNENEEPAEDPLSPEERHRGDDPPPAAAAAGGAGGGDRNYRRRRREEGSGNDATGGEGGGAEDEGRPAPAPAPPPPPEADEYRRSRRYRLQVFLVFVLSWATLSLIGVERFLQYRLKDRRITKALEAEQRLRKSNNHQYHQQSKRPWQQTAAAATSSSSAATTTATTATTTTHHHQQRSQTTVLYSSPPESDELHLRRTSQTSRYQSRTIYWNRAVALLDLKEWDLTISDADDDSASQADAIVVPITWTDKERFTRGVEALQKASDMGHPTAQKLVANALASGFWPTTPYQPATSASENENRTSSTTSSGVVDDIIEVQQDLVDDRSVQQQKAMLLWHMAAVGGDAEAATIVAHRYELLMTMASAASEGQHQQQHQTDDSDDDDSGSTGSGTGAGGDGITCASKLPYYRAAVDSILDHLESDLHSRAKIAPAMDKHVLHQLHLFGGTMSKLEAHNQPDETEQALQFYHVRAMDHDEPAVSEDGSGIGSTATAAAAHNSVTTGSAQAAFTLAHLYHYGLRGVPQNSTTALHYYEYAAKRGHWEAAGHAGDYYFYGIGTPDGGQQDAYAARKYWKLGMPYGVDGCRKRLEQKLRTNSNARSDLSLCDAACLDGMGLLLLMGLPIMVAADVDAAERHFNLAREQGSRDAAYHLAMLKLGWKQHFVSLEGLDHLQDGGQTTIDGSKEHFPTNKKGLPLFHPSHSEWGTVLAELSTASAGGHLQARHRLAELYATGVTVPHKGSTVQVIPKDCEKATKHYKWIIEHASPHRSMRLRKAYKQYMAGDTAGSLRNYLAAAEAGSDLAQVNAAFLLEQGECLGLNRVDCAKASVRLWKASAAKGSAEASLRVGDFYYYGRLRREAASQHDGVVGPFGWVQYLLFPERFVGRAWAGLDRAAREAVSQISMMLSEKEEENDTTTTAAAPAATGEGEEGEAACVEGGTCPASLLEETPAAAKEEDDGHSLESDLEMSARYYRMAAERAHSPRANFNLGFLYEWGLGLKQDFPLAKRHYDLALAHGSTESELPISIALMSLSWHESVVKLWMSLKEQVEEYSTSNEHGEKRTAASNKAGEERAVPALAKSKSFGRPVPGGTGSRHSSQGLTKVDVIISHMLSWEMLLVFALTIVFWVLLQLRRTRRR